ncbi:Unknown protein [Striga hermonthica]|uniref:SHSP domain-containing protein n=1 Tax=Striga hermonthica TaxID=68872 RepID=A0A9N7R127_STRHE|nr:Unknown protein [Striga hermonthica]
MAASLFLNRLKLINSHLGGSLHPTASFLSTKHISPTVQLPPFTASRPAAYRCYFSPDIVPDTDSDDDVGEGFPTFVSLFGAVSHCGKHVDINGYGAKLKLDHDGVHINAFLPGVKRENVKVSVNRGKLCIEGTKKDFEEQAEETKMEYESPDGWIPKDLYNTDQMTANMKDGVLKVFLPRMKRVIKVE